MGDVSGEAEGLFAIKDGVSSFFAATFKKNIEVAILPERYSIFQSIGETPPFFKMALHSEKR